MNIPNKIARIDAELAKTRNLKRIAMDDNHPNLSYWTGYEEGLLYARQVFISLINKKGIKS